MTEPAPDVDTVFTLPVPIGDSRAGAASLVLIHPPGPGAGCRYPLAAASLVIGRGDGCDITLDATAVSRRHARIDPTDGGHTVRDLGSTNGTAVNNERVHERRLRNGDTLRVGDHVFRYLSGGNVEAEYHEEVYRLTVQDALTRLHNRRGLNEFLDRAVARSQRHAGPVSVALLDLDRFKAVNDAHGHACGDHVLREVAELLRAATRTEDLCARYGGEEFALVLPDIDHAGAVAVAERVRGAVAGRAFRFEGVALALTVSAGVATTSGDGWATPAGLLHVADGRLYAAKRGGRNRVVGEAAADDGTCLSTWVVT